MWYALPRHPLIYVTRLRKMYLPAFVLDLFQPINIPAFALSTKVDVDMNQELIAHGYSNLIAGFCGGLQNYMAYTQSVL
jgi:MFS superfamily sulfate permease-like transporter